MTVSERCAGVMMVSDSDDVAWCGAKVGGARAHVQGAELPGCWERVRGPCLVMDRRAHITTW